MYIGVQVKYPLLSPDSNETSNFLDRFSNRKYQISWKSERWEPSYSMWTDIHDEGNSRFSQHCERAQKWSIKKWSSEERPGDRQ